MTDSRPYNRTGIEEIAARNETARHMIAGFAAEMPALADFWRNLDTALAGNLALAAELTRQIAELTAANLDRANLLAAIRATLAAHADGEADPLYYLSDELSAHQASSQRHGRTS